MTCREFILELEGFLEAHPDLIPARVPAPLALHATECAQCDRRWRTAAQSRRILLGLRGMDVPSSGIDAEFPARVGDRIEGRRARSAWEACRSLAVGRRDLVLAVVLFTTTLGSFLYNFSHIEAPNIDEAFALDVPHLHPHDPAADHVRPQNADAMLNLMNP